MQMSGYYEDVAVFKVKSHRNTKGLGALYRHGITITVFTVNQSSSLRDCVYIALFSHCHCLPAWVPCGTGQQNTRWLAEAGLAYWDVVMPWIVPPRTRCPGVLCGWAETTQKMRVQICTPSN